MTVDKMIDLSLLDYLAWKTNCMYLSDLPRTSCWKLLRIIEETSPQEFSLENWHQCFEYLTGQRLPAGVTGVDKVRQYLLHHLRSCHG